MAKPTVQFTAYGHQHTRDAQKRLNAICAAAAVNVLRFYKSDEDGMGVPGNYTHSRTRTGAITGGRREPMSGHPTETDRPAFADILQMGGMGTVSKIGRGYFARFGNRSILDSYVAMYWRKPWGSTNDAHREQLVVQNVPIWKLVEYGARPHPITPRPDRRWLRFVWITNDYGLYFAQTTQHPGLWRFGQGRGGVDFARGQLGRMSFVGSISKKNAKWANRVASEMQSVGSNEPFGKAPFRKAQAIAQRLSGDFLAEAWLAVLGDGSL